MTPVTRRLVAILLLLVWLAALTQNVSMVQHSYQNQRFSGVGILFLGIIGPLELMFSWYANPLLWIGLGMVAAGRPPPPRLSLGLGVVILLLAANAFFWRRIPDDSGENLIIAYGPGFYLWLLAAIGGGAWLIALWNADRAQPRNEMP